MDRQRHGMCAPASVASAPGGCMGKRGESHWKVKGDVWVGNKMICSTPGKFISSRVTEFLTVWKPTRWIAQPFPLFFFRSIPADDRDRAVRTPARPHRLPPPLPAKSHTADGRRSAGEGRLLGTRQRRRSVRLMVWVKRSVGWCRWIVAGGGGS